MPSELPDTPEQQKPVQFEIDARPPASNLEPLLSQLSLEGRLHPFTILLGLMKGLRGVIPVIPFLLIGNRWAFAGFLVVILGSSLLNTLIHYFSFSYRLAGHELITEQGLLERKQRSIPLERVQEIRIEQNVIQRILGVVDARIETGGGKGAEANLSVLSRTEAERLRQAVFERVSALRGGRAPAQTAGDNVDQAQHGTVFQLGIKNLIIAGLTSNHLVSAFVLAGALWNFADDLIPESIYHRLAGTLYRKVQELLAQDATTATILTAAGAVGILIVGLFFSIIVSIVLFYGFTFSRRGEELHRSYGLFTRRASNLPRRRIQVLKIEEKLLRRLFGLATLRADTSGSHREGEDDNKGRDVLIPIVPRREVDELLPIFFNDFGSDRAEWQQVSRLAVRRGTIKGGIILSIMAAASFAYRQELIALWPLALLPLIYAINLVRYRNLAYALGAQYFHTRRGWLGRSTHIVPINKIQAIEVSQTLFDRRLGLATLMIDTAGQSYTGGGPQISNIPLAEACSIAKTLARKAAITRYKW